MKYIIFIIATLFISSCVNENTLHNSFPIQLLHGNSAKVWVLTTSSNPNDKNVSAMNNYRKSYIFYSNNKFRKQELIHLGSNVGLKGKYSIEEDRYGEITLNLYYKQSDRKTYVIQTINNNSLTLLDLNGSQTIWELRSLKPPKL